MEYGMFGAVAEAVAALNEEAKRLAVDGTVAENISCRELQNILDYAIKATKKLKKIKFTAPYVLGVNTSNRFLADRDFIIAVEKVVRDRVNY